MQVVTPVIIGYSCLGEQCSTWWLGGVTVRMLD